MTESVYTPGLGPSAQTVRAAAPELLEALRDALTAIASLPEYALGGVEIPDAYTGEYAGSYPIRDELLSKIDAALSKAEGRS